MQSILKDVELKSIGLYFPGKPIPYDNVDDILGHLDNAPARMKKMIGKLKPTVKELIGINQCFFAIDPETKQINETNTSMTVKAVKNAVKKAGMDINEIEQLILATPVPDYMCPPTTTLVQEELGLEVCSEIEIHSNCTGITKAMQIAFDSLRLGRYKTAAVCYSQLSSSYLISSFYNQEKIKTENLLVRWFLSDSASAVILKATDKISDGIKVLNVFNESVGGHLKPAMWSYFGAADFFLEDVYKNGNHHLGQDYSVVNTFAPNFITNGFVMLLERFNLKVEDIDHVLSTVPSMMIYNNTRNLVEEKLSIPKEKWFTSVGKRGYSGGSSVIISLHDALEQNIFKKGDLLIVNTAESSKWMIGGFAIKYESSS